jgi:hypothetical protein
VLDVFSGARGFLHLRLERGAIQEHHALRHVRSPSFDPVECDA